MKLWEDLLAVRVLLRRHYQPYAELLPEECQPPADWLNRDLLPTLILLPNSEEASEEPQNLALALELSFLAGRVHDLTAQAREQKSCAAQALATSRSILTGDYLYAAAAIKLANAGYNKWLKEVGRLLCRRSEGKLARLSWKTRPYVPEAERLYNLHKENAEGLALAAEMSVAKLDWPQTAKQAWTEFGFYVGLAQGILIYEPQTAKPALTEALRQAERALTCLPSIQAAACDTILNRMQAGFETTFEIDNEKAVK